MAEITATPERDAARWAMAVLFDSVAPLVQMISSAAHPSHAASFSRASDNARSARSPNRWGLEGLPMKRSLASIQACRALGSIGWVAL